MKRLDLIRLYRGDPIAALDAALAEDPDFGGAWAARAGLLVQQTDKAYAEETAKSLRAGAAANLNDRERAHLAAAKDWAEGRYHEGTARYARIAQEKPRDLLALQYAHVGCFFLGLQHELRDWPLQGLRAFKRGEDGHGIVLGMAAFGLEECGDYASAEAFGREAVEIEPRDGWAVHAVAHVNEMRGDLDRGIPWLADNAQHWAPESGFAYHNWWHLALLHLDRGDIAQVLKLYDEQVRPNPEAQVVLEWIDASALLWRLHLEGVDVGDRFAKLAACWERASEDAFYAFNDLHAIMAFLGAGRGADARAHAPGDAPRRRRWRRQRVHVARGGRAVGGSVHRLRRRPLQRVRQQDRRHARHRSALRRQPRPTRRSLADGAARGAARRHARHGHGVCLGTRLAQTARAPGRTACASAPKVSEAQRAT